ncbi:MAG TPA: hypothetical protein VMW73_05020 [Spirochaetia bacterium]|nr:hypothetical protein [Spirochaetia bacterium]
MRLSRLVPILLLGAATMNLSALELKAGRLKLDLFENTGRFSLSYLENPQANQYVPLFFSDDPRTSGLSILQDDSLYRMGDSSNFKMSLAKADNGASFVWTSPKLAVTQEFQFIRSQDSSLVNGLLITVTIKNTGTQPTTVGARYIIDTTLGEHSAAHFRTKAEGPITHEASVVPSAADPYVLSEASATADMGLEIMLSGAGLTVPDKVVLANWKRLNESPWQFDVNASRDFNLLPYSINDSAIAIYYNPLSLPAGGERTIVTAIGNKSSAGFTAGLTATAATSAVAPAATTSTEPALAQPGGNVVNNAQVNDSTLQGNYRKASDLLDQINQLLTLPSGTVTAQELNSLKEKLNALEAQKSGNAP